MGLLRPLIFDKLQNKKEQIKKMDETYYLPEDIDKNDALWNLRTINDIIIAMCGRMTRKSDYGERMEVLSPEERVFCAVTDLYSQVTSMGFEHYYYDEAGKLAMEAPNAFRTIGANERAEVADKALAVIGKELPADDKERANFIRHELSDEQRKALTECDEAFKAIDDDINRLLFVYIREYHYKFTEEPRTEE